MDLPAPLGPIIARPTARGDRERDIVKDHRAAVVRERQVGDLQVVDDRPPGRPNRVDDRRRGVDELEEAARRPLVARQRFDRLGHRPDRLEAGDRGQRHESQIDAVEPARGDEADADGEGGDAREAGDEDG